MRQLKVEILRISSIFIDFFFSLRFGHTRGKTTLSCFLTRSCRFATPFAELSSYLCTPSVANAAFSSNLTIPLSNLRGCLKFCI